MLSPLRQSGYPGPAPVDAASLLRALATGFHLLACSRLKLLPMRSPVGSPAPRMLRKLAKSKARAHVLARPSSSKIRATSKTAGHDKKSSKA